MLPKKYRLSPRSVPNFFRIARKYSLPPVTVWSIASTSGFAATCIVPKRVVALATKRNRIKRLVYQVLQEQQLLNENLGVQTVLSIQRVVPENELRQTVEHVCHKLKTVYTQC